MNNLKSNLAIRSNLFIRQSASVKEDGAFVKQVRGKIALTKLIARLPETERTDHRHGWLNQRQVAELVWETPCTKCGAIPEGPIWRNGLPDISFRCPLAVCKEASYRVRTVSLDYRIVGRVTSGLGLPLSEVVDIALRNKAGVVFSTTGVASSRRPFAIRLSPSQYHFLSDIDIEAALVSLTVE